MQCAYEDSRSDHKIIFSGTRQPSYITHLQCLLESFLKMPPDQQKLCLQQLANLKYSISVDEVRVNLYEKLFQMNFIGSSLKLTGINLSLIRKTRLLEVRTSISQVEFHCLSTY